MPYEEESTPVLDQIASIVECLGVATFEFIHEEWTSAMASETLVSGFIAIAIVTLNVPEGRQLCHQARRIKELRSKRGVELDFHSYGFFYHIALALYGYLEKKAALGLSALAIAYPYGWVVINSLRYAEDCETSPYHSVVKKMAVNLCFAGMLPLTWWIENREILIVIFSCMGLYWLNSQRQLITMNILRGLSNDAVVRRLYVVYFLSNIAYAVYGICHYDISIIAIGILGQGIVSRILWDLYPELRDYYQQAKGVSETLRSYLKRDWENDRIPPYDRFR